MAPPPGIEPKFVNPVSLADTVVAISATTSVLAFVLLSMRLYSTLRITRSASYDDGASIIAFVFSLAYVGLVISTRGNARHGWDLPISAYTAGYFKDHIMRDHHRLLRLLVLQDLHPPPPLQALLANAEVSLLRLYRYHLDNHHLTYLYNRRWSPMRTEARRVLQQHKRR